MADDRDATIYGDQIKDRTIKKRELDATGEDTGKVATVQSNGSVDWEFIQSLQDYTKLQDNIMLNAFRIAINGSLTQFNMIDGIVDEYEDESGIDNPNSVNESYNSADDYYSPGSDEVLDVSPYAHYKCNNDAGNTIVTDDGTGSNNGVASTNTSNLSIAGKINEAFNFNGSSEYINIDALEADIDTDTSGSFSFWVRFTNLTTATLINFGDTDGANYLIIFMSSSKIKALFSQGTTQWSLEQTGTLSTATWYHVVLTQNATSPVLYVDSVDVTNFTISTDKTLWFSDIETELDNGRIGCGNRASAGNFQFLDGDLDDIRYYQNKALTQGEVDAIYNSGAGTEADKPGAGVDNMTLISESFTAEAEADNARIVILEEDVDSITLNTDLKAYASKDGGSSWVQGTLSDEGDYDASKQILVANFDLTQSGIGSGTNMEYKITSHNLKDFKIHASSLNWD